jgi:molecular chaperone GrpE
MTTRKHPHDDGPDEPLHHERKSPHEFKTPIEERLDARIAQERATHGAAKTAEADPALAEANNRYLRLAADFENFKRRTRQEQLDTIQLASSELIGRLLPVLDDLRNALEHKPAGIDDAWAKGLQLSVRKLEEVMAAHGVEPIESVGTPFDPKLHEAIGQEESMEHPEDTVVSELRRGYRIRDRVLRPSLVRVSRRPETRPRPAPAAGDLS